MDYDVVGLGNPLMDALTVVDDDHAVIRDLGLTRGTMCLVDAPEWQQAYERVRRNRVTLDAGGSCANTLATVGRLGGRALFCGQVGDDQMGHAYAAQLAEANGGHALHFSRDLATGKCLSIISPVDAERTMMTHLGAAIRLAALPEAFRTALTRARIAHFTGYELLDDVMSARVFEAGISAADAGAIVSFDAADPFVVSAARDRMWEFLRRTTSVLFLNADEARGLVGEDPHDAVLRIADTLKPKVVVVKMGSKGSLVWSAGEVHHITAERVAAVDTTGAGDSYAAGFLFGLARDWPVLHCAALGNAVAALTVAQVGATFKDRQALAERARSSAP